MKTRFSFLIVLLLACLVLSACSSTEAQPTSTQESEEATAEQTEETVEESESTEESASTSPVETEEEQEDEDSSEAQDQITIYISPESLGTALEEAFEAEYGDVLNVVSGSWCRKINSEQEAGDIQADVIYGAEPVFFQELVETGDLLAYTPEELSNIQSEYQWDNGYYYAADLRYIGIVYNNTLVGEEDLPTTYDEINDEKWSGQTTLSDATQCSAAYAITAALAQPDLDMQFFEDAKANDVLLTDRAGKLPETVASGEAALGIGPHDPVVRLQNKAKKEGAESPVDITWAEDGTYVIPRPIAIIADENRSETATEIAQDFVDFVLSVQGQTLAVNKGGFVSVRTDVDQPTLIPDDLTLLSIDWEWAAENKATILEEFQTIMYGE